jgi:hypothetical protein
MVTPRLSRTNQLWDVNITLMGQLNKRKLIAPCIKLSHATITLIRLFKNNARNNRKLMAPSIKFLHATIVLI